jgi:hypothetical protein
MLACALRYFFFSFRARTPLTCILLYYVSSNYYICVRILLHVCPHTTCVSSYYYIFVLRLLCVLILLCVCSTTNLSSCYYMCPHTTTCVLILRYEGRHTDTLRTFRRRRRARSKKRCVCVCVKKKCVCVYVCVDGWGV